MYGSTPALESRAPGPARDSFVRIGFPPHVKMLLNYKDSIPLVCSCNRKFDITGIRKLKTKE